MNNELYFNYKGESQKIYDLLIENGFDDNEFEVVQESYDEDNIWNSYSINYNDNFYDENDFIELLKSEFGDNIIFIL